MVASAAGRTRLADLFTVITPVDKKDMIALLLWKTLLCSLEKIEMI